MAGGTVKGITISFMGDTTKLDKALRQIKNSTKDIDSELKQVNKALKFNPTSVELWRQKQDLLKQKIKETENNLKELKSIQAQMDAKGVDKNSEAYRRVQREIIEAESKLKTFNNQLRQTGNAKLHALSEQFKQIGKQVTKVGKNLSTKLTAPLVAVGAVGAKKFAEVDKTMQLTNATMNNTKEQADMLNQAMKDAAASSTYGMKDAATATLNFARAGLTAEEAADALAPAMALAAGEGGELDTVSAGLVATINGFHGSFAEASDYADVFANACNNSALDANSLSEAMSVAAPIFSSAGYSVKDAALYMGVMANNGIDADKAANSLKTGLARLVSPAKEGAAMMDKLGISVTNSDGTMKDSVTIQKELHDAFSQLSESEQIAAASAIFGKNQMAPWLALINTAPNDVDKLSKSLDKQGTAMEMQTAMMSGFAGSIEKLKSGLDVAATSLGEALAPAIQKVASAIQKLVDWFNSLSPEMQSVIATIGIVVAAIGPLLVIIGTLASSIGSIISLAGTIAPLLGGVGAAVSGLASGALLPIIAIIAGVIAIGVTLYKNWDLIKAKAIAFKDAVITAFNNLKANVTATFNSIRDAIVTPMQAAIDKVKAIVSKVKSFFPIKVGDLLSGIKLPHFKISGEFSIKNKTVPHLSIDWYKTGGIFDGPQVIGVGEAGPEAVVPLDKLWQKLDNIANASGNGIVININGYNEDPRILAEEIKRILIRETNQRRLAWQ